MDLHLVTGETGIGEEGNHSTLGQLHRPDTLNQNLIPVIVAGVNLLAVAAVVVLIEEFNQNLLVIHVVCMNDFRK